MQDSDIETTTTTTRRSICEKRRAGHGRCPTWFRLLLHSSPPPYTHPVSALFFPSLLLVPSRHMRKQLLVRHPRVPRANAKKSEFEPPCIQLDFELLDQSVQSKISLKYSILFIKYIILIRYSFPNKLIISSFIKKNSNIFVYYIA